MRVTAGVWIALVALVAACPQQDEEPLTDAPTASDATIPDSARADAWPDGLPDVSGFDGAAFHLLTVARAGGGTGDVNQITPPVRILCGEVCEASFATGTLVTLEAVPWPSSAFRGWEGDCSGTGPCTVAMDVDRHVTATFDPVSFALVAHAGTAGHVASTPAGIDCPPTCEHDFTPGTTVSLAATPADRFTGWGGDCSGTADCSVIMDANRSVVATFGAGDPFWSLRLGGTGPDRTGAVALAPDEDVVVAGGFAETADLGGGPVASAGAMDGFVSRFDRLGGHEWTRTLASPGADPGDTATAVGVDAAGNVLVAATFAGTVDVGGGPVASAGGTDTLIVKYAADSTLLWTRRIGSTGDDAALGLAVDPGGDVVVTGRFGWTVDFGGPILTAYGVSADMFVARYRGSDGTCLWARGGGYNGDDAGRGVAVGAAGEVTVTGDFYASIDLGGGPLLGAGIFLAQYDASGEHLWSRSFNSGGAYQGNAVASSAGGQVALVATCSSTDFGGGPVGYQNDICVALFAADGTHLWSKADGTPVDDRGNGVAIGADGSVYAFGSFENSIDLGCGPATSTGFKDIIAVRLSSTGECLWARTWGSEGYSGDSGAAIALDPVDGAVVIGGEAYAAIDFGTGLLEAFGSGDAYVGRLAP